MRNHRKLLQLIKDNLKGDQQPGFRMEQRSPLAADGENRPAILLYDVIDPWWGASAESMKRTLMNIDAPDIDLFINSPGGDVFEATAMHSALISHPANIHVHIEGYAASAATRVAMAGNSVEIAESGFYMIHYAWTLALGNSTEIRQVADMLDKVDATIVADYMNKTGKDEQQVRDWMAAETWFTAAEAVEHGFVDKVIQPGTSNKITTNARNWNLGVYQNAPTPKPTNDPFPQRDRLERFAAMLHQIG